MGPLLQIYVSFSALIFKFVAASPAAILKKPNKFILEMTISEILRANVSKGRESPDRTKKSNSILFYQKTPLGRKSSKCMSKKSGDFYFFQNSRKLKRTADTHFSATLFPKKHACSGSPRALRNNPMALKFCLCIFHPFVFPKM